ncbi:MAG: N(5)-(carboxyethyl)ornithine synthase [Clostridiales Family XIII bacterium]|jgi:N5-(carboxyethyl)ornithine synthase|nr:N(5)-(carboxyethyl)ornithine synthase [Clostridiales Family XIII bacterium]
MDMQDKHNQSKTAKKTMGFLISHKENEKRRALLPQDIAGIQNKSELYFEVGYGDVLGIDDKEYTDLGCHICSRKEALAQSILCEPKIGESEIIHDLAVGQDVFGWMHKVANGKNFKIANKQHNLQYAWENMREDNRHCFWRNNELAGEAAVVDAFMNVGKLPHGCNVAVLGRGSTAQGAVRILTGLGADVTIYSRTQEALFKKEFAQYDVIVNAIIWDGNRCDHIIHRSDLKSLKKHALIIDISCDENGAIETSVPTTMDNPIFKVDGITHYVVDHTPSILYHTSSEAISLEVSKYIDDLIESNENDVLCGSLV